MKKHLLLINCIFSMLISYSFFLRSFISQKKLIDGFSDSDDLFSKISVKNLHSLTLNLNELYDRSLNNVQYQSIVIVLIDALRVDFTKMEQMSFLQSRLQVDRTFVAKVQPPTVTLPRIKALTTGSIPGFVDVVLNFGSSSLTDDNVITQMKRHQKKMVFYGDDTWLNLFPDHFIRFDGTTSFFVTDYTEVDNNVTRHLDKELEAADFDLMVLHYLGLDHIGHLAGPFSPLIGPKLQEMDNVIKNIYQKLSMNANPSLIIVCGDHGMSDQGGHGGATDSETRVPVIFLKTGEASFKEKRKESSVKTVNEIEQIDIAPTLSILLGVPIPKNNIGTVITDVLSNYDLQQKLMVLTVNAHQVSEVLKYNRQDYDIDKGYQLYTRTYKSFLTWMSGHMSTSVSMEQGIKLLKQFEDSINQMSSKISLSVTQYDEYGLFVSIVFLWLILFTLILTYTESNSDLVSWQMFIFLLIGAFGHMTVCTSDTLHSDLLCDTSPLSIVILLIMLGTFAVSASIAFQFIMNGSYYNILRYISIQEMYRKGSISLLLIFGTVLHTISLLSSSFVEEEHQTWYFYTVTAHVLILKSMVELIVNYKTQLHSVDKKKDAEKPTTYDKTKPSLKNPPSPNHNLDCNFKEIHSQHSKSIKLSDGNFNKETDYKSRGNFIPTWKNVVMVITVLVLCRLMRTWNQTGNKWLNIPDVGDWLIRPENLQLLSAIVVVSLIVVFLCKRTNMNHLQQFLYGVGLVCVYLQKSANGSLLKSQSLTGNSGVIEAQIVYVVVLLYTLMLILCIVSQDRRSSNKYRFCSHIHTIFTLVILVLARPHNIVLVSMMVVQEVLIEKYVWSVLELSSVDCWTLYFLWMGHGSFFYQGNSNSISTVDVSAGYIGLHDYQPVMVGCLLTIATYGGLVFWLLSMLKFIFWKSAQTDDTVNCFSKRLKKTLSQVVHILCLSLALPLAVYTVLVTCMRYHLFVWTVFSPKLLYEGMLTVVLSAICFIILLGSMFC